MTHRRPCPSLAAGAGRQSRALLPSMAPIYADREPADLKPHLEAAGIERIVVVQAAETLAETLFTIGLPHALPLDRRRRRLDRPALALASMRRSRRSPAIRLVQGVRPVARRQSAASPGCSTARLEPGWRAFRAGGTGARFPCPEPRRGAARHAFRPDAIPTLSIVLDHCAKPDIAGGRFEPWASDHRRACRACRTSPASSPACSIVPARAPAPPSLRPIAAPCPRSASAPIGCSGQATGRRSNSPRPMPRGGASASNCSPACRAGRARRRARRQCRAHLPARASCGSIATVTAKPRIGFIGVGLMGHGAARNILERGGYRADGPRPSQSRAGRRSRPARRP